MFFPLKDDQPRFSTPYINYFLIALNLLIFFFQWSLGPRAEQALEMQFAVIPSHLTAQYPFPALVVPFFTSMFLHGSWLHVISNMWALYIFGDNVEDYLGHFQYLLFYILAGLAAMATHVALNFSSSSPTVGASGAIAGVMGAYFVLYPRARVLTWLFFVIVVYIPAWVFLGLWFLLQLLDATVALQIPQKTHAAGGVAFWAHVGGFIAGAVMIKLFPERRRRSPYAYR